jgi:HEAT repeat protein
VRRAAADALGAAEDPAAVDALLARRQDPDAGVRAAVAEALGDIEDHKAVPALLVLATDRDTEVKTAALHALARMEDPAALDAAKKALGDAVPEVRLAALRTLASIEDTRTSRSSPRRWATRSPRSAPRRRRRWVSSRTRERRRRSPAQIKDPVADVRVAAVEALGELEGLGAHRPRSSRPRATPSPRCAPRLPRRSARSPVTTPPESGWPPW